MLIKENANAAEYVNCNLCNSDSAKKIMLIDGFNIVKCRKCGLVYVNPRLKPGELQRIYMNESYFQNPISNNSRNAIYGYEEYVKEKKDIIETFARRLRVIRKYRAPGKLLDIGCAFGFFLELASSMGWEAEGIEISKIAYDYAKKNQKSPVFNCTLDKAKYKKERFDVITLFDVIEHAPNPKKMLKTVNHLLKPGGIIAVTTPNIDSLPARILGKKWEEVRRVREHIYFFSRKTLKRMLEESGFTVLKTETAGRVFSVQSAIKRLRIYSPAASKIFAKFVKLFALSNAKVYINPHYKITMYARRKD